MESLQFRNTAAARPVLTSRNQLVTGVAAGYVQHQVALFHGHCQTDRPTRTSERNIRAFPAQAGPFRSGRHTSRAIARTSDYKSEPSRSVAVHGRQGRRAGVLKEGQVVASFSVVTAQHEITPSRGAVRPCLPSRVAGTPISPPMACRICRIQRTPPDALIASDPLARPASPATTPR